MSLPRVPLVVLDTETTGFVPKVNRIIEYAHIEVRDGEITEEYEQLISIPTQIPPVIQTLTRIRPQDLEGQPDFAGVREDIVSRIAEDAIIVGQNISFDIRMLKGEGIDLSDRPWIDTSMLASLVFPELASYSLGYMSTVLQLNHTPVHRALGDVRATLELLEKCWERILELPADMQQELQQAMQQSSPGYQQLFADLPPATATERPDWLTFGQQPKRTAKPAAFIMSKPEIGTVDLVEEPLDPGFVERVLHGCSDDAATVHWVAVKNVPAFLQRTELPDGVRVLQPPHQLLDTEAAKRLLSKTEYTADEATLSLKLRWYEPVNYNEAPIHGDEKSLWHGTLACTSESQVYLDQFTDLPAVMLIDHWQLLTMVADSTHPGHSALTKDAHVIVDDASMLEDTATKAYGYLVNVDALRAAASDDAVLTKVTDLLQLWLEKMRQQQDVRYITPSDLAGPNVSALRDMIAELDTSNYPAQTVRLLTALSHCIAPEAGKRISYVETRNDGGQFVSSVPESVALSLKEHLFDRHRVTLLIPPKSAETMPEILGHGTKTNLLPRPPQAGLRLRVPEDRTSQMVLSDPPVGKSIVLINSRKAIEALYIKFAEDLEEMGITLLCQGMSGGQGRTQAEFAAAPSPAVWVMTPWQFEGIELPPGTITNLFIDSLPFDHPSHAVISRRAEHHQNAFMEYSLPRLEHRLFRLLRTCRRLSVNGVEVELLDARVREKRYGKEILNYLSSCCSDLRANPTEQLAPENWQMNLF